MSKIKLHQIIAIVGVIIFMILKIRLTQLENTVSFLFFHHLDFEFLVTNLLTALAFIYIPLILHEFIKTSLMKVVQSEKNKIIIVCVMVGFLLLVWYGEYADYKEALLERLKLFEGI